MLMILIFVLIFIVGEWLGPAMARKGWVQGIEGDMEFSAWVRKWEVKKFFEKRDLDPASLTKEQLVDLTDLFIADVQRRSRLGFGAVVLLWFFSNLIIGNFRV